MKNYFSQVIKARLLLGAVLVLSPLGFAEEAVHNVPVERTKKLAKDSTNLPRPYVPADLPKVNSSSLSFDGNGYAYYFPSQRVMRRRPLFTGIAFTEGDNWRAEVTYVDGIPDGEVVVIADNQILYRFRYEKGIKVLSEAEVEKASMDEVLKLLSDMGKVWSDGGGDEAIYRLCFERAKKLAERANQTKSPSDVSIFKRVAKTALEIFNQTNERRVRQSSIDNGARAGDGSEKLIKDTLDRQYNEEKAHIEGLLDESLRGGK